MRKLVQEADAVIQAKIIVTQSRIEAVLTDMGEDLSGNDSVVSSDNNGVSSWYLANYILFPVILHESSRKCFDIIYE